MDTKIAPSASADVRLLGPANLVLYDKISFVKCLEVKVNVRERKS